MKLTVESVEHDKKKNEWVIVYAETDRPGGQPDIRIKWVYPYETFAWRVAEYNLDPADLDVLIDVVVCERFIPGEFFDGDDSLFNAGDIETARVRYLAEIARVKLENRVSTRGVNSPFNLVRQTLRMNPGDLALKSMTVIMRRHRTGAQVLDPAIARSMAMLEHAIATGNADLELNRGKGRA